MGTSARCLKLWFALALAVFCAIPTLAATPSSWVLVTRQKGTVESNLHDSQNWLRITKTRRLGSADKLRTAADGAAQLRLNDNSLLAMGPNTQATMDQFLLTGLRRNVSVKLDKGSVRTKVAKYNGRRNKFHIVTPNSTMAAQGTEFLTTVDWLDIGVDGRPKTISCRLEVLSGTVTVMSRAGLRLGTVGAGNAATVVSHPDSSNLEEYHNVEYREYAHVEGVQGDNLAEPGLAGDESSAATTTQSPIPGAVTGDVTTVTSTPTHIWPSTGGQTADEVVPPVLITPADANSSNTGRVIIDIGNVMP